MCIRDSKVPQLYNLKDSPFYGHGGSFSSIREVIKYKNRARSQNDNFSTSDLATDFVPLRLSNKEIDQLNTFLTKGLYDPALDRYVPTSLPSGNCFPNNDLVSKIDLGYQ